MILRREASAAGGRMYSPLFCSSSGPSRPPSPPLQKRKIATTFMAGVASKTAESKTAEDARMAGFVAGWKVGWENRRVVEGSFRSQKLWQREGKTERKQDGWEKTKDVILEDVFTVAGVEKVKGRELERAMKMALNEEMALNEQASHQIGR